MSRYVNKIEVKDPNALTEKIALFLQTSGLSLGDKNGETLWWKKGVNCIRYIKIEYAPGTVIVTAFITYFDAFMGDIEAGIKGFVAGFGKWPLAKIVRKLENLIRENAGTE